MELRTEKSDMYIVYPKHIKLSDHHWTLGVSGPIDNFFGTDGSGVAFVDLCYFQNPNPKEVLSYLSVGLYQANYGKFSGVLRFNHSDLLEELKDITNKDYGCITSNKSWKKQVGNRGTRDKTLTTFEINWYTVNGTKHLIIHVRRGPRMILPQEQKSESDIKRDTFRFSVEGFYQSNKLNSSFIRGSVFNLVGWNKYLEDYKILDEDEAKEANSKLTNFDSIPIRSFLKTFCLMPILFNKNMLVGYTVDWGKKSKLIMITSNLPTSYKYIKRGSRNFMFYKLSDKLVQKYNMGSYYPDSLFTPSYKFLEDFNSYLRSNITKLKPKSGVTV